MLLLLKPPQATRQAISLSGLIEMKNFIQKNAVALVLFSLTWLMILALFGTFRPKPDPLDALITTPKGKAPMWAVMVDDLIARGVIQVNKK